MRAAVSQVIVDEIKSLKPEYPRIDQAFKNGLSEMREQLECELGFK
jgi:hypothetical protein